MSVAYKNVIGSRRASWRVVTSIEQNGDAERLEIIKDFKAKIEAELIDICNDILEIIEGSLIPNSTSEEAKVFYYKMKGDYQRYLAEFSTGSQRKDSAENALTALYRRYLQCEPPTQWTRYVSAAGRGCASRRRP